MMPLEMYLEMLAWSVVLVERLMQRPDLWWFLQWPLFWLLTGVALLFMTLRARTEAGWVASGALLVLGGIVESELLIVLSTLAALAMLVVTIRQLRHT